jgi:4-hydroxybenzoate polyprenyltransferase
MVRACHPEPTLAVTVVATALAATVGRPSAQLPAVAAAVLAGQLSVGWLNDLLDADRDAAVGRPGKPVAAGLVSRRFVLVATLLAAAAAVALSLLSGLLAAIAHWLALVSAWAYDLGVKATALSVLPYVVSFGLLSAFVVLGLPGAPLPPVWLVATASLLGSAAHFANTLPDLEDDAATGVRGLPHRLGRGPSIALAALLLLAATLVLVFGPPGEVTSIGWLALLTAVLALGGGLLLARRPGSRSAFHAVLVVAVVDVALLLAGGISVH